MIFRKFLLLVLGFAAIAGVPAMMFAYSLLKPAEPVIVKLDTSNQSEVSFFALGDQGVGNLRQWQVADAMNLLAETDGIDGVFLLGDSFYRHGVESSTDLQWRYKFENVYDGALANTPFYATPGNHDYYGNEIALVIYDLEDQGSGRWQMPARDYLRVFGQSDEGVLARVAFIDTGLWWRAPADTTKQLDDLLSAAPPASWTLVVTHTPLVSANDTDVPPGGHEQWQPVLAKHGVDLVLSGHDHNMQLIRQAGWPLAAIVGTGGKSKQTLDQPDLPGLLFSAPGPGFSRLTINPEFMTLEYWDDQAQLLKNHEIERGGKAVQGQ